jgi:hypothetical protein
MTGWADRTNSTRMVESFVSQSGRMMGLEIRTTVALQKRGLFPARLAEALCSGQDIGPDLSASLIPRPAGVTDTRRSCNCARRCVGRMS